MKIVGIEEHFITIDVRKAWQSVALGSSDLSIAPHSGVTERRLFDLADSSTEKAQIDEEREFIKRQSPSHH